MKMKEVMEKTGLTRKTVLFYEEQGLLTPQVTRMNGREYREYDETHIELLRSIATLRKSGFSIDEIRRMQASNAAVQPIFMEYRQRLTQQKQELDQLFLTVSAIQPDDLGTMQNLIGQLHTASASLPLPASDCTPHFRYLDDEESKLQPPPKEPALHADAQPVKIDQDHLLNTGQLGMKKTLDDLKEDLQEQPGRGVPNQPAGSCLMDVLEAALVLVLVLTLLDSLAVAQNGGSAKAFLPNLIVIGVIAVLLLGGFWWRRRRRR